MQTMWMYIYNMGVRITPRLQADHSGPHHQGRQPNATIISFSSISPPMQKGPPVCLGTGYQGMMQGAQG